MARIPDAAFVAKAWRSESLMVTSTTHSGAPTGGLRPRRRRSKLPLLMAVSMIVVVGWLAAKYFTGRIADTDSLEVQLPRVDPKQRCVKPPAVDARIAVQPTQTPASPPSTAAPPAKSTAVKPSRTGPSKVVASYPLKLSYPLSQWSTGNTLSGFLDTVVLDGRSLKTNDTATPVDRNKVLTAC